MGSGEGQCYPSCLMSQYYKSHIALLGVSRPVHRVRDMASLLHNANIESPFGILLWTAKTIRVVLHLLYLHEKLPSSLLHPEASRAWDFEWRMFLLRDMGVNMDRPRAAWHACPVPRCCSVTGTLIAPRTRSTRSFWRVLRPGRNNTNNQLQCWRRSKGRGKGVRTATERVSDPQPSGIFDIVYQSNRLQDADEASGSPTTRQIWHPRQTM